mmetsp:Transcript_58889/g.175227  ORF Transcript_58889/g.175227 Transcript_58889/m.175227 type:complete len:234 (+) Transcript_58889:1482-2183(+)
MLDMAMSPVQRIRESHSITSMKVSCGGSKAISGTMMTSYASSTVVTRSQTMRTLLPGEMMYLLPSAVLSSSFIPRSPGVEPEMRGYVWSLASKLELLLLSLRALASAGLDLSQVARGTKRSALHSWLQAAKQVVMPKASDHSNIPSWRFLAQAASSASSSSSSLVSEPKSSESWALPTNSSSSSLRSFAPNHELAEVGLSLGPPPGLPKHSTSPGSCRTSRLLSSAFLVVRTL